MNKNYRVDSLQDNLEQEFIFVLQEKLELLIKMMIDVYKIAVFIIYDGCSSIVDKFIWK